MDSLTQIVLGAAVGEAVLGRKVGNKAMFYGAIAGTIPDLDMVASYLTDTVSSLAIHRGFTHSIAFSMLFAPLMGWLVSRFESYKNFRDWSWLFFWSLVTHPILDAHTTWGTQLFWPFDVRLAFKTIFVIDPIYTLPFLVFLILAMRQKRTSPKRKRFNTMGLIVSTGYLLLTFLLKWAAFGQFEQALKSQKIAYLQLDTRPSPLNTILWSANVETENAYLLGNYSFLDTQPISFVSYPKNHELLGKLVENEKIKRMISISEGWYTITENEGYLYFNDLRFGLFSMKPNAQDFVFKYKITVEADDQVVFTEEPPDRSAGKRILIDLWKRVKGN
ncbi:metal-dependent hydrolase [Allomuricauda sp. F6463D]|uniref:metal-dependent hydrolase n=1 Tax=Allomuricauda sp. F6463D TaxID=2926409 RepID=UPI001FF1B66E|nr:metal-dependent hydrolase [Muricauda sp. F6463D]MCK0161880.1 metal-dependent hydrolase [Muricauda sp. F6463D]